MPPQAYALVTLFVLSSIVLGWAAVRLVARSLRAPHHRAAYTLPIVAAFGAFYLIGHRLRPSGRPGGLPVRVPGRAARRPCARVRGRAARRGGPGAGAAGPQPSGRGSARS